MFVGANPSPLGIFAGSYDLASGGVRLVKSYIGEHDVWYDGRNEDDGLWLWGVWEMRPFDRGGFHMWPAWEEDPTKRRLGAEQDLPAQAERKVLVELGV